MATENPTSTRLADMPPSQTLSRRELGESGTIAWAGCGWEPRPELFFQTGDQRWWTMDPSAALQSGAFELATSTPSERDWLRRFAEAVRDSSVLPLAERPDGVFLRGRMSTMPGRA
jgi:hypothetical protein